ncbi:hypothetical protein CASFOL_020912 [Castilleja foliolosa]|uniref:Uncharacterized protein n=1 Tax=Castilleja foliolosa TaxID=1961234 RepID=A0ABD3D282_9LAMI
MDLFLLVLCFDFCGPTFDPYYPGQPRLKRYRHRKRRDCSRFRCGFRPNSHGDRVRSIRAQLASATLTLLTAPAVYCTSSSATSFLLARFFTGFSLSTFVSTQFWMSSLFSPTVVGTANCLSGGWGNLGGGATQLIMPLVFDLIRRTGAPTFTAWRIAFFIPALFQTLSAYGIFFLGQDLPDGNYSELQQSGDKHKDKLSRVFYYAVGNYRGWILALTYGYCFGVELTIDNIIAQYFYDRFDVSLHTAGPVADAENS